MTAGPSLSPALGGLHRPTAPGVFVLDPGGETQEAGPSRASAPLGVPGARMTRVVSVGIRGSGRPRGGTGEARGRHGGGPGQAQGEAQGERAAGGWSLRRLHQEARPAKPAGLRAGNAPGQAVTAVSRGPSAASLQWSLARAPEEGGDPAGGNRGGVLSMPFLLLIHPGGRSGSFTVARGPLSAVPAHLAHTGPGQSCPHPRAPSPRPLSDRRSVGEHLAPLPLTADYLGACLTGAPPGALGKCARLAQGRARAEMRLETLVP